QVMACHGLRFLKVDMYNYGSQTMSHEGVRLEAVGGRAHEEHWQQTVHWLGEADSPVIAAGAGMGGVPGLPDFRGDEGLWRAYPALREVGLNFVSIASPQSFRDDPELAWGFYGHRLNLYRHTQPHDGFRILRRWADKMEHGAFVYTSNVDGQFQKAGFSEEQIVECHGSLHWLQCMEDCTGRLWKADTWAPGVAARAGRLRSALPRCVSGPVWQWRASWCSSPFPRPCEALHSWQTNFSHPARHGRKRHAQKQESGGHRIHQWYWSGHRPSIGAQWRRRGDQRFWRCGRDRAHACRHRERIRCACPLPECRPVQ